MQTIDIKDPPFLVGDKSVAKITVTESTFTAFVGAASRARALAGGLGGADYKKFAYRERIKVQSKFFDATGEAVAISDTDLLQMPVAYAKKLYAAIDVENAKPGKVIQTGDGVTKPIIFELGTPIPIKDKGAITELEFMAKTLGDIENVMCQETEFEQAVALIQSVARPLGSDAAMLALPSWAIDGLSVPDGVIIARSVLPSFLE